MVVLDMRTPLFPENDAPITMIQGNLGDCYLIAAIDCVVNYGPEGYKLFKSMFTVHDNGVEIRIANNPFRKYLNHKIRENKLDLKSGKYGHYFDSAYNQDVFFLPDARLNEIDSDYRGVKTNSLAVKVLERIATYYYSVDYELQYDAADEKEVSFDDSLVVHNIDNKFRHPGYSSAQFIAELLNLKIIPHAIGDVDKIIKLKIAHPAYPIYIGMTTSGLDGYGTAPGAHAFRLNKIYPSKNPDTGGYVFGLVDPHNTEIEKFYSLSALKKQAIDFFVFNINPQEYALVEFLLTTDAPRTPTQIIQEEKNLEEQLKYDIEQAVREKSIVTYDSVRQNVLRGLGYYYFNDNLIHITASGGLRDSFTKGSYTKDLIEKVLPPSTLLLCALILIENATHDIHRIIGAFNAELHQSFMDDLRTIAKKDTPRALFETIHAVSILNSALAQTLFLQVKDSLPTLFPPKTSFYSFAQDIEKSASSDFKTWFESNAKLSIPAAQDVQVFAKELVEELESHDISCEKCTKPADITNQSTLLHKNIASIINGYKTRPGFANPLEITEVKIAYDKIVRTIELNEERQKENIKLLPQKYLTDVHIDDFLIIIDDYGQTLLSKKFDDIALSVTALEEKIQQARTAYLTDGDQDKFKKCCGEAMTLALKGIETRTTDENRGSADKVIEEIKSYAKMFKFSIGTNHNPGLFGATASSVTSSAPVVPSEQINVII